MNPIKKLAGQTVIYGLSSIVPKFLNYLLVPLHTHVFQKAEYGVVTELYSYVTFLVILLTYGMETGFFRFSQKDEDAPHAYGTALISLVSSSLLFVLLVSLFTDPLAGAMKYTDHPEYLRYIGWILTLDTCAAIPFARLRLQNKALRFAIIKIINVLTNLLFTCFFLWFCPHHASSAFVSSVWSPDDLVRYVFISNLLASITTLILLLPQMLSTRISFRWSVWKSMLTYSLPLLIAGLAGNFNEVADRILLKHRLVMGQEEAMAQIGVYGANIKIAVLMTLFIQMFRYAAEPFFFSNAKAKDSKETIAEIMKFFILSGLCIFLGITLYIDIFKYFNDSKFWEGLHIVPIMAAANLCLGIYYNLSIWFKLKDKTYFGIYVACVGALISIFGNWLLIPRFGYTASAWLHLTCYVVMGLITYIVGQKKYPIPYDKRAIGGYILLAGILFAAAQITPIGLPWLNMLKNTLLLLVFVAIAVKKEYKTFLQK